MLHVFHKKLSERVRAKGFLNFGALMVYALMGVGWGGGTSYFFTANENNEKM